MKLLDILVKELPKIGGWPRGISVLVQSSEGEIYKAGGGFPVLISHLAEDWELAEVTHLQYETEILEAPPKIAWNGEGLPPVGCEFEMAYGQGDWKKARLIAHGEEQIIFRYEGEIEFSGHRNNFRFRPILSEAERKREEAINKIQSHCHVDHRAPISAGQAIALYDAIAAGKIPGIRIE